MSTNYKVKMLKDIKHWKIKSQGFPESKDDALDPDWGEWQFSLVNKIRNQLAGSFSQKISEKRKRSILVGKLIDLVLYGNISY